MVDPFLPPIWPGLSPAHKQGLPVTFLLFVLENKLFRNQSARSLRAFPGLTFTLCFLLPPCSSFFPGD